MARLKVRLRGKAVSDLPLAEDRQYMAGRKDGCDIHLQGEKGISREHFRLSCVNGNWTVETLSRFGELLLAGEKVSSVTLEHGMMFTVPPYEFEFLMTSADAGMPAPEPVAAAPGGEAEPPPAEGSLALVPMASPPLDEEAMSEKTVVGVAPSTPYIKIMGKDGEAKELIRLEGGDLYLAGRDSTCNIHIRDARVSRRQFEIRKTGSTYSIIDLGSVNGTLLNGNPISTTDPTPLKSGDAISVLGDSSSTGSTAAPGAGVLLPIGGGAPASTSGQDGTGSGTQALADVTAPVTVGGDAVSVIGDSTSSGSTADTGGTGGTAATGTAPTTSGSGGTLSGTQIAAPITAPVTVGGNAVSVIGTIRSGTADFFA